MKFLLLTFSIFSRLGTRVKDLLYRLKIYKPEKAPLPVISVGNIAFGGSEKTPLVMSLLSFLLKKGIKPALVSRGYKGRWERKGGMLSDGTRMYGDWKDSGDEPFMVAKNASKAGIFIGKSRIHSCQNAKDLGFEVAILDDGFQHQRLHRDLDIVLYDPKEKISLREPVSSLKRAHIILVKKTKESAEKNKIKTRLPNASLFGYTVVNRGYQRLGTEERLPADAFKGKRVLAFCGIARPERFYILLKEGGMDIVSFFKFPDHHFYPYSTLSKILTRYHKQNPELVITTEKDAVKIAARQSIFKDIPLYYVKVELDTEEEFYEKIISLLQNFV
ncbi:MAG: tetraacyldisaccharide 4'-kinase [Candidatus Aminicenantaceae bacterium]